jgi:hypothetical protein
MKSFSKVVVYLLLVALFLASGVAWSRTPIRDGDPGTIGACLTQPDGSRVTLPCEEVIRCGRSGKSFAIKEWFEPQPAKPRLAVVSTRPLPVKEYWNVDVTGILSTFSGVSRDGSEIRQRVLIVSPENVTVYCSPNGKPVPFMPIKGLDMDWPCKRSLADLASEGSAETASVSVVSEGSLPSMPDSLDSEPGPIYCATIGEAKAQTDGTAVELQCRPVNSTGSGFFILGEDGSPDALKTYYTGAVTTSHRVVRVTGIIQTEGTDRVIDVDSGPGYDPQGFTGSVTLALSGTIAWAKTFADWTELPTDGRVYALENKPVSWCDGNRVYIEEADRSSGILLNYASLPPDDSPYLASVSGTITTNDDGERSIDVWSISYSTATSTPRPLGMNNRSTVIGLRPNGLLLKLWGRVTAVNAADAYIYIDDGSGVEDGTFTDTQENVGVRVQYNDTYFPSVGDFAVVTGPLGTTYDYGTSTSVNCLRTRGGLDAALSPPPAPTGLQAI